jgi:hypothetical protein
MTAQELKNKENDDENDIKDRIKDLLSRKEFSVDELQEICTILVIRGKNIDNTKSKE